MTQLLSHLTLKLMLSASPSVERNSSKEKVRLSSLPLNCNWDRTNLIHSNIKLLRGNVHLSISPIILGYFESSLEHTTFKGGESNENSGLGSASVLSLSQSLEVTSMKFFFLLGIVILHPVRIPPFSIRFCFLIRNHFLYKGTLCQKDGFRFCLSLRNSFFNLSKVKIEKEEKKVMYAIDEENITKE